ncbi:HAD-IC family P-type ATPase [Candidatus Woesearchaeota archaeon]|nr:HAD-IC family P-type ATPase [Candidatus Woesearchaeota archaeon]
MQEVAWHSKSQKEVLSLVDSAISGLSSAEAGKRLERDGYNEIKGERGISPISLFFKQFASMVIMVLLLAAVISYFTNHKIEFIVILVILLLSVIISFSEEYKASKDMEALISLAPKKSTVIRDNKKQVILSKELAIGDILVLERGDIVGADARIIEANNIRIDESLLTGESLPVTKTIETIPGSQQITQQLNMVFAGTNVTDGNCVAVIVKTAENTEMGKVSGLIKGIRQETTPLQKRLDKLAKQISFGGIMLAIAVFFIGYMHGNDLTTTLLFSLAVIVSGIPESLPTVVAVTLAAGVKKMADKNAIVKRLPAVETLGTCSVICSDKTGTLTQNKMVVENIFTYGAEIKVTGNGYDPKGIFLKENIKFDPKKHNTISKILEIGILCNNSDIKKENNAWKVEGEATEGALIVLARKAGIIKVDYHRKFPRKKEHPFDPVRKCMSTVHLYNGKNIVYSKGAPELLLKKAKYYFDDGKIKKITSSVANIFLKKNKDFASKGLRVIGLAFKEHKGSFELHNVESGLVFVGLVSIRDPLETSALESIKLCKEAGIKVVMITGDNESTARAIAAELGILGERDMVLTGKELDNLSDAELGKVVERVAVYARVTPAHKLRIVEQLQKAGHVVAMTGDGVNDAPALKKADIGIAMGRCGTEVAKESSDIILKDDNFTTIVNAVEQGRATYENIRKFVYYLLVTSFSEVLIIFIAVLVGTNLPLTALMILFLNLVTGQLPALGLGLQKPPKRIMNQKPRNPKEGILSDYLLLKIGELIPLVVLGTIVIYILELVIRQSPIQKAQTVAFATIVFFELFHSFNAMSWTDSVLSKEFFSNLYVVGGTITAAILTILAIHLPLSRKGKAWKSLHQERHEMAFYTMIINP